jgi:16S rRNA (guanine527-N7)-methyltransferase
VPESVFDQLNRHVKVSHETVERLSLYHDLLLKWQTKVNLVGPDTIGEAWQRHFLDSLQLLNILPTLKCRMLDFGTGAGFPGMILAIAGVSDMHLVESDAKKITFLKEVARITKTNVSIHHGRIEQQNFSDVNVILSRACSALEKLFVFSSPFVSHGTTCLFHKGKNYSTELEDANEQWDFDSTVIPSVTDAQGVILKISNLRKRGV